MKQQAVFIWGPRTEEEMKTTSAMGALLEYEIVKTVRLGWMEYENFATDMLVDREFLEEAAEITRTSPGQPARCVLVRKRFSKKGILVIPRGAYVRLAALYPPD